MTDAMKLILSSSGKMLFLVLLVFAGCASHVIIPVVTEETQVSRENALLVMGVTWLEKYNDTEEMLEKILYSTDLVKDKTRLRKLLKNKNGSALSRPLHYLSRFQFQFDTLQKKNPAFIRFDKDVREYEEIAIHEFVPGRIRLDNIAIEQLHFDDQGTYNSSDFRWKKHWLDYEQNYGSWDLHASRIAYIGHLVMYFKTRRFIHGLLTPEELVRRTQLVAVVIEDRFDEVRKQLKKEKPWFPVDEMVNQSKPEKWVYFEDAFADFHSAQGNGSKTDKKKAPKRNKIKYFF